MNAVLFQFIEPKKTPWDATRRDKTQMEKRKLEDGGKMQVKRIQVRKIVSFNFASFTPDWVIAGSSPSGVGR